MRVCGFSSLLPLIYLLPRTPVPFYCLNLSPLPDHLSINLPREPLLSPCPVTIFSYSQAPTYLGLFLLYVPNLFSALSYLLVSETSFSFISLPIMSLNLRFAWLYRGSFPPSLSHISLAHLSTCILISVGLGCLSLCLRDPYLSIYPMSPRNFPSILSLYVLISPAIICPLIHANRKLPLPWSWSELVFETHPALPVYPLWFDLQKATMHTKNIKPVICMSL